MAQLAAVCYPGRKERQVRGRRQSRARQQRSIDLGTLAEKMLREMAFVYQTTRSIRESMAEEAADVGSCRINRENDLEPGS
jgi:hypothetical protein